VVWGGFFVGCLPTQTNHPPRLHDFCYWLKTTCAQTHTHTEICNTHCFSTSRMISLTRLTVTLYVYCVSCFFEPLYPVLWCKKTEYVFQRLWFRRNRSTVRSAGHKHFYKASSKISGLGYIRPRPCMLSVLLKATGLHVVPSIALVHIPSLSRCHLMRTFLSPHQISTVLCMFYVKFLTTWDHGNNKRFVSIYKHMSLMIWISNRCYIFSPNHLSLVLTQETLRRRLHLSACSHAFLFDPFNSGKERRTS
jgi:hypothetical protein